MFPLLFGLLAACIFHSVLLLQYIIHIFLFQRMLSPRFYFYTQFSRSLHGNWVLLPHYFLSFRIFSSLFSFHIRINNNSNNIVVIMGHCFFTFWYTTSGTLISVHKPCVVSLYWFSRWINFSVFLFQHRICAPLWQIKYATKNLPWSKLLQFH